MNKQLQEELKVKLQEEKNSLQKELEKFASQDENNKDNWNAKYPNREDGDKDDDADEVQEYDQMLSLEHSLETKLKEVNVALEKMDAGTYGICEKCGKPISEDRLA